MTDREEGWLKVFEHATSRPVAWWLTADRLKVCADLLWETYRRTLHERREGQPHTDHRASSPPGEVLPIEYALPAMMLYGFSIECLTKGVLIRQKAALLRPRKAPKWPTTDPHDIERLCRATGVSLSAAEGELLSRPRDFVRWRGRYPMPFRVDELFPRDAVPGGGTPFVMSNDRTLIDRLYERLYALLGIELENES